jgi:hypothetical protein
MKSSCLGKVRGLWSAAQATCKDLGRSENASGLRTSCVNLKWLQRQGSNLQTGCFQCRTCPHATAQPCNCQHMNEPITKGFNVRLCAAVGRESCVRVCQDLELCQAVSEPGNGRILCQAVSGRPGPCRVAGHHLKARCSPCPALWRRLAALLLDSLPGRARGVASGGK